MPTLRIGQCAGETGQSGEWVSGQTSLGSRQ
jgi:hypothetical protein